MDLILTYGESRRVGGGCLSIYLTRTCIENVRSLLPKADIIQMQKQQGAYLIVDDCGDEIITAAWSSGRFRR